MTKETFIAVCLIILAFVGTGIAVGQRNSAYDRGYDKGISEGHKQTFESIVDGLNTTLTEPKDCSKRLNGFYSKTFEIDTKTWVADDVKDYSLFAVYNSATGKSFSLSCKEFMRLYNEQNPKVVYEAKNCLSVKTGFGSATITCKPTYISISKDAVERDLHKALPLNK